MKTEIKKYKNINYVFAVPDDFNEKEKYPFLIVLHGAGSRGNNAEKLLENPFFKIDKNNYENFVIAAPQCPENMTWFDVFEQLKEFTKFLYNSVFADEEHFYCMGPSMGGYGTWQLAMSMPEIFAAVVPICGGGMYWNAERLLNVPVWAFHGAKDNLVMLEESEKMVNALNNAGGKAKLTVYPENGHNAWSDTYANPEVAEWLLQNKKQNSKKVSENKYAGSEFFG